MEMVVGGEKVGNTREKVVKGRTGMVVGGEKVGSTREMVVKGGWEWLEGKIGNTRKMVKGGWEWWL